MIIRRRRAFGWARLRPDWIKMSFSCDGDSSFTILPACAAVATGLAGFDIVFSPTPGESIFIRTAHSAVATSFSGKMPG